MSRCCAETGARAQNVVDLHAVADFGTQNAHILGGNDVLRLIFHHGQFISGASCAAQHYIWFGRNQQRLPMPYDLDLLHTDDW